ncbi:hypothetical protein M9Y10_039092 [Tritrichomonas musculus]|uniref:Uncharacterized protein n=1 Tax=Tritrichomonas musculus TaxID=1915356 RepID=A0ABR2KC35_9EUKA
MSNDSEYILEFVVHYISCVNTSVQPFPLIITLAGFPDILLNPKSATVCKITYEKGKRIGFSYSHLLNLKASFMLEKSYVDPTIIATCSFDFFELTSSADEPIIYDVEIGMDKPNGERFGMLSCTFQLMPSEELIQSLQNRFRTSTLQTPRTTKTPRKITGNKLTQSPRQPSSQSQFYQQTQIHQQQNQFYQQQNQPYVPEIQITQTQSQSPTQTQSLPKKTSRSALGGSIHERYMKKNELWIGHHCSTHSEEQRPRRTVSVSRATSSRSKNTARNNFEW